MSAANLAQLLAQWVRKAGIDDQDTYQEAVWNKTKDVMKEFVEYMEGQEMISYAANCDNAGWEHSGLKPGQHGVGQKVGDKIVCVLMVGALFFMNWGTRPERHRQKEDDISENIREHLRCIIAHMFSAVLNESVCKSQWGTNYAWHTVKEMDTGKGGVLGGLIERGICGRDVVAQGKIQQLELNAAVKAWLGQNKKLQQRLNNVKGTAACQTKWQPGWKIEDFLKGENNGDTTGSQIVQIVHGLQDTMTEIFKDIGKQAAETIQNRAQAKKDNLATDDKNQQTATKPATSSKAPS
ncbi:hypothetical protein AK88_05589, partial [Plasmodium fragile]